MSNKNNQNIRDFDPVVLQNRPKTVTKPKNISQSSAKNILSKMDNEEIKLPTVPMEMSKEIQNARINKKMSQIDLAKRCNLSKEIIRDYENGTIVPNRFHLSTINHVLGTNIKMPAPIKIN